MRETPDGGTILLESFVFFSPSLPSSLWYVIGMKNLSRYLAVLILAASSLAAQASCGTCTGHVWGWVSAPPIVTGTVFPPGIVPGSCTVDGEGKCVGTTPCNLSFTIHIIYSNIVPGSPIPDLILSGSINGNDGDSAIIPWLTQDLYGAETLLVNPGSDLPCGNEAEGILRIGGVVVGRIYLSCGDCKP